MHQPFFPIKAGEWADRLRDPDDLLGAPTETDLQVADALEQTLGRNTVITGVSDFHFGPVPGRSVVATSWQGVAEVPGNEQH